MNFKSLRDCDFLEKCRQAVADLPPGRPIRIDEIAVAANHTRPRGYYLNYEYTLRRLREHRRRPIAADADGHKRRQWQELSDRVTTLQLRHGLSDAEALQRELAEGAPSQFFLSPTYAVRLLQRLRQSH